MAKAAKVTLVEAENIVPVGNMAPNDVHLPGIYVIRIVRAIADKEIEIRKLRESQGTQNSREKSPAVFRRDRIARRSAKQLKHGYHMNLCIGIPILASSFLPPETPGLDQTGC